MAQDIIARGMAAEALKKVEEGGGEATAYYRHIVEFYSNDPTSCSYGNIRVEMFNTEALAYDFEGLAQYLVDNGYTYFSGKTYPCIAGDGGTVYITGCYADNQDPSDIKLRASDFIANSQTTFKDTVLPFVAPVND